MVDPNHPAILLAEALEAMKKSSHATADGTPFHIASARLLRQIPALEAAAAGIADAEAVIAWATSENRKPSMFAFPDGPERQAAYWIKWAENRTQQDYQRLMDKHNALHVRFRAARDRMAALEAERHRLLADMRRASQALAWGAERMPEMDQAYEQAAQAIAACADKEGL